MNNYDDIRLEKYRVKEVELETHTDFYIATFKNEFVSLKIKNEHETYTRDDIIEMLCDFKEITMHMKIINEVRREAMRYEELNNVLKDSSKRVMDICRRLYETHEFTTYLADFEYSYVSIDIK